MSAPIGKTLKSELAFRDSRKARLADAGLLEVFMKARKACLGRGLSVIEANERAHEAVDAHLHAPSLDRSKESYQ